MDTTLAGVSTGFIARSCPTFLAVTPIGDDQGVAGLRHKQFSKARIAGNLLQVRRGAARALGCCTGDMVAGVNSAGDWIDSSANPTPTEESSLSIVEIRTSSTMGG
jgi:hypothetical protein